MDSVDDGHRKRLNDLSAALLRQMRAPQYGLAISTLRAMLPHSGAIAARVRAICRLQGARDGTLSQRNVEGLLNANIDLFTRAAVSGAAPHILNIGDTMRCTDRRWDIAMGLWKLYSNLPTPVPEVYAKHVEFTSSTSPVVRVVAASAIAATALPMAADAFSRVPPSSARYPEVSRGVDVGGGKLFLFGQDLAYQYDGDAETAEDFGLIVRGGVPSPRSSAYSFGLPAARWTRDSDSPTPPPGTRITLSDQGLQATSRRNGTVFVTFRTPTGHVTHRATRPLTAEMFSLFESLIKGRVPPNFASSKVAWRLNEVMTNLLGLPDPTRKFVKCHESRLVWTMRSSLGPSQDVRGVFAPLVRSTTKGQAARIVELVMSDPRAYPTFEEAAQRLGCSASSVARVVRDLKGLIRTKGRSFGIDGSGPQLRLPS